MDIYIYREKKVFYNIEGQLRGFQLLDQPKTCAPQVKIAIFSQFLVASSLASKILARVSWLTTQKSSAAAVTPANALQRHIKVHARVCMR
jgi:hypothetical protein